MVIFESIMLGLHILIVLGFAYVVFRWIKIGQTYGFRPFREFDFYYRHADARLEQIIELAQREVGIRLSWGAREMLAIPILESIEMEGRVEWEEVEHSIRDLVRTVAEDQDSQALPPRSSNSIAIIRGFYKRFCNIPPFCSRNEG